MRRRRVAVAGLALALVTGPAAAARAADEEGSVRYQRRTEIVFGEGDLIDGTLHRPDGELVQSRRVVEFRSMLKLRADFRQQILDAHAEL